EIIRSTEDHGLDRMPPLGTSPSTRGGAITRAAVDIAATLEIPFLVAFTQSGDSARRLSRLRAPQPIYAFTHSFTTSNTLCLSWGVIPRLVPFKKTTDEMTEQIDHELVKTGVAEIDDLAVMVAGSPPGVPGSTNMLKIHRVGFSTAKTDPGHVETYLSADGTTLTLMYRLRRSCISRFL